VTGYYVGVVVGAIVAGVVIITGDRDWPRWASYAINCPLVAAGAAAAAALS
jgi:hypothetical protein